MKLEEKTLEKEYIYNGKIINVRVDVAELPNGRKGKEGSSRTSRRSGNSCIDRRYGGAACQTVPLSLYGGNSGDPRRKARKGGRSL